MKKILLILVILFTSITNAQVFEFNTCISENQFTVEELAAIRQERIDHLETFNTTNISVVIEDGGNNNELVKLIGVGNQYIKHFPAGLLLEDLGAEFLTELYDHVEASAPLAQAAYDDRAGILKFIQDVLADGNTTIEVTDYGTFDSFDVSFEGAGENESPNWSRSIGTPSIETLDVAKRQDIFDDIRTAKEAAQAEYDARVAADALLYQIEEASASNSLRYQTQSDLDAMTDDEIRDARIAELKSISDDNTVNIQPQWMSWKSSYGVSITIRGNILETFLAKDYGNPGLNLMTAEEFNDYYVACWLFVDNTL